MPLTILARLKHASIAATKPPAAPVPGVYARVETSYVSSATESELFNVSRYFLIVYSIFSSNLYKSSDFAPF